MSCWAPINVGRKREESRYLFFELTQAITLPELFMAIVVASATVRRRGRIQQMEILILMINHIMRMVMQRHTSITYFNIR